MNFKKLPAFDRLFLYLNDMRLGIAPDESTPDDERTERLAQIDIIDCIMDEIDRLKAEEKRDERRSN